MTSTFWGLRLEPGKRYSTTVEKSFHVSMAALDCNSVKNDKDLHCVMLKEGESDIPFILCNLQKPKILQVELNHQFETGDRITLYSTGSGTIHLTGYIIPDEDDLAQFGEEVEDEEDEEEVEEEEEEGDSEEEDEEVSGKLGKLNGLAAKRKKDAAVSLPSKKKKLALEDDSGDDSEEEDEEEESDSEEGEEKGLADSGEDSADSEEVVAAVKGAAAADKKKQTGSPTGQQQKTGAAAATSPGEQQLSKKQKKKLQQQQQQQTQQQQGKQKQQNGPGQSTKPAKEEEKPATKTKQTLQGGVSVQDLKVGNGTICKPGKVATVYYTGRLKTNNKVFDSTTQGAGFKFRVGRGEVIKGWDVGLSGMKVGGKRLITCPPNMAYGQKGMPPTIPANSTLVFEVELKNVT